MSYPPVFMELCSSIALRLTSQRKSILFVLWEAARPLKAYEILDNLIKSNKNAQAPAVYRVLDYYVELGIVHKIESIQSYTLCCEPDKHLPSEILMVCNHCHRVQETYDQNIRAMVTELSSSHDFFIGQNAIELRGLCVNCNKL